MGYLHIENLYKDQRILLFRECYAMEKIHGTSARVWYSDDTVQFSSGGEKRERFLELFDIHDAMREKFRALGHPKVTVFGEAYGGSQQGQSWRYGKQLRFVAFEVKIGDGWLHVPSAHDVATKLGLEFVDYEVVSTDVAALNAARDAPSVQAKRNGVEGDQPREGVVLRPLIELVDNAGARIIAKHKRDEERETATPRAVVDPAKQAVLVQAQAIADEWVTPTRLEHVLSHLGPGPFEMKDTAAVIKAMVEDVEREAAGEIVESRDARVAIGKKTAQLFKRKVQALP